MHQSILGLDVALDSFKKGFGIDVASHAKSRCMSLISDVQIRSLAVVACRWSSSRQFKCSMLRAIEALPPSHCAIPAKKKGVGHHPYPPAHGSLLPCKLDSGSLRTKGSLSVASHLCSQHHFTSFVQEVGLRIRKTFETILWIGLNFKPGFDLGEGKCLLRMARDRLDQIESIIDMPLFFAEAWLPIRQQYPCLCSPRNGTPFSAL